MCPCNIFRGLLIDEDGIQGCTFYLLGVVQYQLPFHYRPVNIAQPGREGNVFTGTCHSIHRGSTLEGGGYALAGRGFVFGGGQSPWRGSTMRGFAWRSRSSWRRQTLKPPPPTPQCHTPSYGQAVVVTCPTIMHSCVH